MNSLNKIFKIIGLSLLVWSLCSCTEEKISRHQTVLDEELSSQRTDALSESEQTQDFAQFSEDHLAIQAKINSNDNEQWIQALDELKVKLFGPGTGNQSVYGSRQYAGYLALYRSLYGKWSNNSYDHSESFKTQFQESLNQFKTTFVDSCTDSNVQDCDYLRHSLRRVGSVVDIIEYFARNENDDLKKLALIGVAFEVGNQRAKQNLTELYIDTYFKLSESGTSIPTPVRHSDNIVTALRLLDWENPNPDTIRYMKIIKPWVNDSTGLNQAVETMRPFLSPFIAIYALVDEEINNQFTTHTSEYWRNFVSEKKSLNTYPAYDNINIQQLFDLPAWEYHLLFAVYFNEMSITEANNLIRNFPNKEESLSRMITAAKIIVRWDLALLSIDTMAKVGTYYSNEPIKSAHHVNDSKAYANTFRNEWVGFHNGRVEALQGLLESQTVSLSQEQILDLSEFFSSIDRNIMKTVIYPAMMIFIYEMIRSDYQETLFGVFQIDTDLDIELFFSGSFRGLWFDYLKAEDGLGRGELSRKISLFRHEIIDAMYYVFATRAHESFGVEMDDFISVLMKDLLIERELLMTIIQEEQRQIYGREDSRSRQWITWCEGLKSGQSQPEVLRYYELDRYLMQHSKAFFGDIMEFNKDSLDTGLFYSDEYHSDNFDYIYRETLSYVYGVTAFSRIRQEAMPIMDNYKIVIESMERLKTQYPQIFSSDLQASKEYYSKFDNRMRSFLGQHIHYGEMVDDCLYQSVKESRRRSQEIIKSEYDYISKIVYPIMKEVSEGRLTVEDGNNLLYKVNGNTDHYDSKIVQGNQTEQVFYKYSKSSYMNRTRQYLTRGLTFDEEGFETVSIEPVVGSSMSISVPADALISPDNPFRGAHYREVYYSSDMSPDQ
ncbi:MAG: hypothetical protein HRT44_02765 [Bdellovibrionales bacterium]|nr:hypothetical protein [Bdellovibrionales bacterium]NQZ18169.1 hypothetical protein [Bdellovibrionales bacterium]